MYADHFQPEKIIAAGPSAKVYRGVETATGRKVLIKALLQDHETPHALDRERLQLLAPFADADAASADRGPHHAAAHGGRVCAGV